MKSATKTMRSGLRSGTVAMLLAAALFLGPGCSGQCGTIQASSYDQSCGADSDCVAEPEGDFCGANKCTNCANAVISVKSQAQYEADLANKISTPITCPCPAPRPPVCDHGKCAFGSFGARPDASTGN
jgi:hypothetical protein